jgi:hypothetical protein
MIRIYELQILWTKVPLEKPMHDRRVCLVLRVELGKELVVAPLEVLGPSLGRHLRVRIHGYDDQILGPHFSPV